MGKLYNIFLTFSVVFLALYIEIPKYHVDPEALDLIAARPVVRAAFYSDALSQANSCLDAQVDYVWGRTTTPHFSLDLHDLNAVQKYTELKEFVWTSVTSGPWLVSFAVMNLQYADILVASIYRVGDATFGGASLKAGVTIPLVSPLIKSGSEWVPNATGGIGPSSPGHKVLFSTPPLGQPASAAITFTEREILFDVSATFKGEWDGKEDVTVAARITGAATRPATFMGLAFPLGQNRPSLVNKMAAVPLVANSAQLTVDVKGVGGRAVVVPLPAGALAMDYTRGLLRRHTEWFWACVSDPATGTGFHLSAGTYDVDGASVEAALFSTAKGGSTAFLDERVSFTALPVDPSQPAAAKAPWHPWKIESPSISLVFTPRDGYGARVNVKVINVNLDHQWGTFSGTVKQPDGSVVTLDEAPGVFEDHDALW